MKTRTCKAIFEITVLHFLLSIISYGQIGGISGAKLCVPEASVLPSGGFEFEPSFSVFNASSRFCENGTIESLSGKNISSNVSFRVTAGVADDLELGASFSSTIEQVSFGSKYIFFDSKNLHLALIAGISLPAGNKFIADTLQDDNNNFTSSYGSIATLKLDKSSSLDIILSYTRIHGVHPFNNILSCGIGVGRWLSQKFQGVLELNGFVTWNGQLHSDKLSILPGITYRISSLLLFVLGAQFDLIGKNEDKGYGYFSAFTMTFN